MSASKVLVRGVLLLLLSVGILAAPLVLTVGGTGNVRAEQPAITLSLAGPAAGPSAASNAIQPPGATSTPGKGPGGQLVSYKRAPLQAPLTNIVISQLRTTGPAGSADEFIDLFNPTTSTTPVVMNGWSLWRSDCSGGQSQIAGAVPASLSLAAGQHYLIGGLSYAGAHDGALVDIGVADTGGIALEDASLTIVDSVGFCTAASDFSEGTPLPTQVVTTSDQSYERKFGGGYGSCLDNNDNATDFLQIGASTPPTNASPATPCTYPTISGSAGVALARLDYTEGQAKFVNANASAAYTIQVADGWSGTVTPSLTGYTFTPVSMSYTNVIASATQNYTAAAATTTPASFAALSVLINEVGWAGTSGSSADQWIELYNTTSSDINLGAGNGWVLETSNGSLQVNLRGTLAAGHYYLLVHDTAASATQSATGTPTPQTGGCVVFSRADITYDQAFTGTLSQSGQILYLIDSNGNIEDSADRNGGSWPGGTISQQRSMERRAGYTDTQLGAWGTYGGTGTTTVHDCNGNAVRGTPKLANWVASNPITPSPTATKYKKPTPAIPTPFAHIVINEFLPRAGTDWNQDGKIDVYDEFIELKNLGPIDVDLRNWKLDDEQNAGSAPYTLPSKKLAPGERAVYYHSTTNILLDDSGDAVRLINPQGVVIDARTYGPVEAPDQSHCRIPDGYYWTHPCFPTPGLENSLTGTAPAPPPAVASGPPPCLLADSIPAPFRQAECNPYGADMWDQTYWDKQAGQNQFLVPDSYNKATTIVQ